jgi:pilus assembly protein Flp/PilA
MCAEGRRMVAGWQRFQTVRWFLERRNRMNLVKRFLQSEDGPTATEYAVMLALIIIVALAAITTLGKKVETIFTNVDTALTPAASAGGV